MDKWIRIIIHRLTGTEGMIDALEKMEISLQYWSHKFIANSKQGQDKQKSNRIYQIILHYIAGIYYLGLKLTSLNGMWSISHFYLQHSDGKYSVLNPKGWLLLYIRF